MIQRIRVDTEDMRRLADAIDRIGSECGQTAATAAAATNGLNDYGGQLPIKKNNMVSLDEANHIRDLLREDASKLRKLAEKFEHADKDTVEGFKRLPSLPPIHGKIPDILWDPDAPDGTVTRPGDNNFGPSQHINLEEIIPGFKYKPPKNADSLYSRRLCGELTAFHVAGIKGLLTAFMKIMLSGDQDLIDKLIHDKTLLPEDMERLFKILGVKADPYQPILPGTMLPPEAFQDILDKGGKVVVLVNIDTSEKGNGKIVDPNKKLDAGHWVSVERMWVDANGVTWVEVYNPYNNQYEAYRWDTLAASMQQPGKGNDYYGGYFAVYPDDSQGTPNHAE
jgi:hypothetical protein